MNKHGGCPSWRREDVTGDTGVRHGLVLGDVRLIHIALGATSLTICSVRRRAGRTTSESDRLFRDVTALSDQLRSEVWATAPSRDDEAQPAALAPA